MFLLRIASITAINYSAVDIVDNISHTEEAECQADHQGVQSMFVPTTRHDYREQRKNTFVASS